MQLLLRPLVATPVATVVACASQVGEVPDRPSPAAFPHDWSPRDEHPEDGPPPDRGGPTITLRTEAGLVTFPAVDQAGRPVSLRAGAAWSDAADPPAGASGDAAGEHLIVTDGSRRYRLDEASLTLVDGAPWRDETGASLEIALLASGTFGGEPRLLGVTGADVRVFDPDEDAWSAPVPLALVNDDGITTSPFEPTALAVLHLTPASGTLVALSHDGHFMVEGAPLQFVDYLVPSACSDRGATFSASVLSVTTDPEPFGPVEETISLVSGDQAHVLEQARCFADPAPLVDSDAAPLTPSFATGVDFDGDGVDTMVWGRP